MYTNKWKNNDAEAQGEQQQQKSAAYNTTRETWQIPKRNGEVNWAAAANEREREREKLIAAAWQQQSHHEAKHTCTHTLTARPTFCFYYRAQQSRLFACCCCCCRRALINEIIIIRDVGPLSLRLSLFAFNRDTLKVANTKSTKK